MPKKRKSPTRLMVDLVIYRPDGRFLFVKRKYDPFEGQLALPGGEVESDETVEQAAIRELLEETGVELEKSELQFVGVFSEPGRDPRGHVVSVAYFAEVPVDTEATAGDDARDVSWLAKSTALKRPLAFDHKTILRSANGYPR